MRAIFLRFAFILSLAVAQFVGTYGAVRADDPGAPPAPTGESAAEALPPGTKLAKIEAYPPSLELAGKFAYRQLLLTGVTAEGARIDVTRLAQLASPGQAANVISVSSNRLARAAAPLRRIPGAFDVHDDRRVRRNLQHIPQLTADLLARHRPLAHDAVRAVIANRHRP